MDTEAELITFFATAGRGTEIFAASEITNKLTPSPTNVSNRDGKVFFTLSSTRESNLPQILALKSVERLFVAITDYDNVSYIQTKRTFLDKLMSTLSQKENFINTKVVLDQLTLLRNRNKNENKRILHCVYKSAHVPETDIVPNGHCFLAHPNANISLRGNCVSKEDLEGSCGFNMEPVEKYRKLDIPCSETEIMDECTSESNQEKLIVPDLSSGCSKQADPNCEPLVHTSIDNSCETSSDATFICSRLNQNCDSKHIPESDNNGSDERCVSFRMSVKCSGKVSKWINLKKLSKDLGWRVAKATGWRIDLRHPQFDVCLHISDEHVTVGVPLTRFPLSKRVYMADAGLRAPVAWIMSQLASIKPGDIVLDPMCGKATVLIEASSDFTDAWFMGSDNSSSQIDKALQNVNSCGQWNTTSLLKADGLDLPFRDSCLDVVLSDAPFNQNHLFELTSQAFYCKFIKEISRVLSPGGRCVLLVSEQLKHIVLAMVHGMETSQTITGTISPEGCYSQDALQTKSHENCLKTKEALVSLTFISSHYMKLGETHACIIVLHKIIDLTHQESN